MTKKVTSFEISIQRLSGILAKHFKGNGQATKSVEIKNNHLFVSLVPLDSLPIKNKKLSEKVHTFLLDNRHFRIIKNEGNNPVKRVNDLNRLANFFSTGINADMNLEELLKKDPKIFLKNSSGLGKNSVEFLQFLLDLHLFPTLRINNKKIKSNDYLFMSKLEK